MKITCSNARPSSTDPDMAVDVDVTLLYDDGETVTEIKGVTTLVHNPDDTAPNSMILAGYSSEACHNVRYGVTDLAHGDGHFIRDTMRDVEFAALACAIAVGLA